MFTGANYYAHELAIPRQPGARHVSRAQTWRPAGFRPEIGSEEVVIIAEIKPESGVDCTQLAQDIKQRLLDQTGLLVFDVYLANPGWLVKTTSGKISRVENLNKYQAALGACPVENSDPDFYRRPAEVAEVCFFPFPSPFHFPFPFHRHFHPHFPFVCFVCFVVQLHRFG